MIVTFEIPGTPHAKQRARSGFGGRHYTPTKTVNAEAVVRLTAAQHFREPLAGPVRLEVLAVFAPPASWSKRKTAAMLGKPHVQRPDLDNIYKSVCDGLNGIAYADDGQVAEVAAVKRWGPRAHIVVTISHVAGANAK